MEVAARVLADGDECDRFVHWGTAPESVAKTTDAVRAHRVALLGSVTAVAPVPLTADGIVHADVNQDEPPWNEEDESGVLVRPKCHRDANQDPFRAAFAEMGAAFSLFDNHVRVVLMSGTLTLTVRTQVVAHLGLTGNIIDVVVPIDPVYLKPLASCNARWRGQYV
jgi:hypothetical protein